MAEHQYCSLFISIFKNINRIGYDICVPSKCHLPEEGNMEVLPGIVMKSAFLRLGYSMDTYVLRVAYPLFDRDPDKSRNHHCYFTSEFHTTSKAAYL